MMLLSSVGIGKKGLLAVSILVGWRIGSAQEAVEHGIVVCIQCQIYRTAFV